MAGNLELGAEGKAAALGWGAQRIETREREAKRMEPLQNWMRIHLPLELGIDFVKDIM